MVTSPSWASGIKMAVFINNLAQLVKSFFQNESWGWEWTDISHMPVIGTRSITSSCRLFGVPDKVLDNVWGVRGLVCVLNCSTLLAEVREMAHKYSSSTLSARIAVIFQRLSSWAGKFIFTVLSGNKGYSRVSMGGLWWGHVSAANRWYG